MASVEALKQKGRQVELDRKKLELDVGTRAGSVARLKTQQYQTRKNDEFQAMGHEIERYENEISKIEDAELELMVEADKVKADLAVEEKKGASVNESIARQMTDLEAKSKALQSRLEELTKERAELAGKIDEDLLGRFERLLRARATPLSSRSNTKFAPVVT